MIIVNVCFTDWDGNERSVDVTSDMVPFLYQLKDELDLIITAVNYIRRRFTEWYEINSVKIVAK